MDEQITDEPSLISTTRIIVAAILFYLLILAIGVHSLQAQQVRQTGHVPGMVTPTHLRH